MPLAVGLVAKLDDSEALRVAAQIYGALTKKGLNIIPEAQLAQKKRMQGGVELNQLKADLVIIVGGDGTILKTCMLMPEPETPLLPVNMGRRGYLAEIEARDVLKAVQKFVQKKCFLDRRVKLELSLKGKKLVEGLNEVVVASSKTSKLIDIDIALNDEKIVRTRADGVIVATPTGSTAYALSAGGPVLDSSLDAFVVAFLASLDRLPPLVLPMDKSIKVELPNPKLMGKVVVDGRFEIDLAPNTPIEIRKAQHAAVFVRIRPSTYYRRLMRLG